MLVALNFAEVSSHFPIAGSVFQWTKYLAGRPYAWFTGWIYIFAGVFTVTAVVVTLPLTILPMLNLMGWHLDAGALHDQIWVAGDHARRHHGPQHLQRETRLDRQQHRRVLRDRRTRVFAVVMLIVHRHQSISIVTNSGGLHVGSVRSSSRCS
jgi:hypothetical protein